jgi:hypothetical protein
LLALALAASVAVPPASASGCAPTPTYDGAVTSPSSALAGWPLRRATTAELVSYTRQVGSESARVRVGQLATSWNGTPLVYALVGTQANVRKAEEIAAAQRALRDPRSIKPRVAGQIIEDSPAIVWYAGNVHGLETSGADAAIEILYELAARTDCEVRDILDELVIGIIPTQNPDGRDAAARTNAYGFDMNRDWFARTQPEINGVVNVLRAYPPVMYIDAHEMGSSDFFFPPNDDPIHHEISDESLHWINDIYSPAIKEAFAEHQATEPIHWDYFNYQTYDLFYMGYGDSAPSTGFTAAGMTFEKGTADPDDQRQEEQFVAGWASIVAAAENKDAILRQYHDAHRQAIAEGKQGRLQPNHVVVPGNELRTQVPDLRIRSYFIRRGPAQAEVLHLIERLMDMDVEVYRLKKAFRARGLQGYGEDPRRTRLPKGTYWIPMEQPQKHWIQALLGEDPYGSLVYFYDVSAWSNPLLMDVDASFTGSKRTPKAKELRNPPGGRVLAGKKPKSFWFAGDTARAVAAALELERAGVDVDRVQVGTRKLPAGAFVVPKGHDALLRRVAGEYDLIVRGRKGGTPGGDAFRQPKVALYTGGPGGESLSHLRYTLDQVWHLPYTPLNGAQVAAGQLTSGGYDVFLVPGVDTSDLDPAQAQVQSWVEGGGVFVGTARGGTGGTGYAITHGMTSATQGDSGDFVPGTLFRMSVPGGSPVALGSDGETFWYNLEEPALEPSTTGLNPVAYPSAPPDFWLSGYAEGAEVYQGTAGLVEETMGDGRVILFSGEPNYRAYTEGSAFFLANAVAYPDPAIAPRTTDVASPAASDEVAAARADAQPGTSSPPITFRVPIAAVDAALDVLSRFTSLTTLERTDRGAYLRIPNPGDLDVEQHPFAFRLLPALERAGVRVLAARL